MSQLLICFTKSVKILALSAAAKIAQMSQWSFLESKGSVKWNWLSNAVSQSMSNCGNVAWADS